MFEKMTVLSASEKETQELSSVNQRASRHESSPGECIWRAGPSNKNRSLYNDVHVQVVKTDLPCILTCMSK